MSQLRFTCSGCGVTLAVGVELGGKLVACPKCKQQATVPHPPAPPPPAPAFEVVNEPLRPKFGASAPSSAPARDLALPPLPPLPPEPDHEEDEEIKLELDPNQDPEPEPGSEPEPESDVELVEEEEERISFPCMKCKTKLKVGVSRCGQSIECPKCAGRTMVPDAKEVGGYDVGGVRKQGRSRAKEVPLAAWWPDGKQLKLPTNWRLDLEEARKFAEGERWQRALNTLHDLQKLARGDNVNIDVLRKPLAYCLAKWSAVELDRISRAGKLSKPIRKALKLVESAVKWGGQVDTHICPACSSPMGSLVGTIQLRTAAGSVYLCCAAPTDSDEGLIREVQKVAKKLTLASGLDPESAVVQDVMEQLPPWYRAVDLSEGGWAKQVVDTSGEGGGGAGGLLGGLLGEALGDALGDLLS